MATLKSLIIKIGADISELNRALQNAERSIQRTSRKLRDAGDLLTRGITIPLGLAGGAAIKMAMDAVESENLFDVSMGKMAKQARQFSEEVSKSLGLNAYEVRKNIGMFNTMFTSLKMGEQNSYNLAKGLSMLAYDMASFYNIKPDEAFLKLSSGINGEVEPLKQLGIVVNETTTQIYALSHGLIKQGQQMTENQKVLARYGVILDATKTAQGDLARTITSPANQFRLLHERINNLIINIGMALLPVFQKVIAILQNLVPYIQALVDRFKALNPNIQNGIILFVIMATVVGPLLIVLSKLTQGVGVLITILAALTTPVGLVIGAIAILAGAIIYLYNTNEDVKAALNKAWIFLSETIPKYISIIKQALSDLDTRMYEWALRTGNSFLKTIQEKFGGAIEWLQNNLGQYFNRPKDAKPGLNIMTDDQIDAAVNKYKQQKQEIQKSSFSVVDAVKKSFGSIGDFTNNLLKGVNVNVPNVDMKDLLKNYNFDINQWAKGIEQMPDMSNTAVKAVDKIKEAVKSFVESLKQQTESFANFVGLFERYENKYMSGERLITRLKNQIKTLKDFQDSLSILQQKGASEDLISELRKQGPNATNSIRGLAAMSSDQIQEYNSLYSQRNQIAQDEAYKTLANKAVVEGIRNNTTVNINITGNEIKDTYDLDKLANELVKKLKSAGVVVN